MHVHCMQPNTCFPRHGTHWLFRRCPLYLSDIVRNSSHYIRDFYPFKRNHTPKLRLRQLDVNQGLHLLQQNALNLKFQEIGKVLFTDAVLRCTAGSHVRHFLSSAEPSASWASLRSVFVVSGGQCITIWHLLIHRWNYWVIGYIRLSAFYLLPKVYAIWLVIHINPKVTFFNNTSIE